MKKWFSLFLAVALVLTGSVLAESDPGVEGKAVLLPPSRTLRIAPFGDDGLLVSRTRRAAGDGEHPFATLALFDVHGAVRWEYGGEGGYTDAVQLDAQTIAVIPDAEAGQEYIPADSVEFIPLEGEVRAFGPFPGISRIFPAFGGVLICSHPERGSTRLSLIDASGERLWQVELEGFHAFRGTAALDGRICVYGDRQQGDASSGAALILDAAGQVLTQFYSEADATFTGAAAGADGSVLLTGDGATLFSGAAAGSLPGVTRLSADGSARRADIPGSGANGGDGRAAFSSLSSIAAHEETFLVAANAIDGALFYAIDVEGRVLRESALAADVPAYYEICELMVLDGAPHLILYGQAEPTDDGAQDMWSDAPAMGATCALYIRNAEEILS